MDVSSVVLILAPMRIVRKMVIGRGIILWEDYLVMRIVKTYDELVRKELQ